MASLGLTARLDLDGRGFQRTLDASERKLTAFGSSLKSRLGSLFAVSAITGFVTALGKAVADIKDLSDQLGISTGDVQRLQFAAADTGLEFGAMTMAVGRFQEAASQAKEGNEKMIRAFQMLGVQVPRTQADIVAALKLLGRGLTDNVSPEQIAALNDLFGRSGFRLVAALRELAAETPIQITSDADVKRLDELDRKLRKMKLEAQAAVGTHVAGRLEDFGDPVGFFLGPGLRLFEGIRNKFLNKSFTDAFKKFLPPTSAAPKAESGGFIGPPLPSDHKERLKLIEKEESLQEKIFKLQLDLMPQFRQRRVLQAQITDLIQRAEEAEKAGNRDRGLGLRDQAATLAGSLAGLFPDPNARWNGYLNQLQQIGGFYNNPSQNRLLNVAEKSHGVLQEINRKLSPIGANTGSLFGER